MNKKKKKDRKIKGEKKVMIATGMIGAIGEIALASLQHTVEVYYFERGGKNVQNTLHIPDNRYHVFIELVAQSSCFMPFNAPLLPSLFFPGYHIYRLFSVCLFKDP